MGTALRTISIATAAAAITACAANPRVGGVAPSAPPAMRVWIGYPIGRGEVHPIFVNREAHVAMFEIIPGRGATLIYPRSRTQVFESDAHFADLRLQPGRSFYHTDPFGYASAQPRYYYVVASAAPLNLSILFSSLGATRRLLGRAYGSFRPYDVIDRLTEIVVPMQRDEDWATDLFVDWPMPPTPHAVHAQRLVRCANGRVIVVPRNYPYFGCPGDTQLAVVATATQSPIKELPVTALPRPPRGEGRRPIELSAPETETGRRATTSDRPPPVRGMAQSPADRGIRYSDAPRSTQPVREPARTTPATAEPSPGNAGRTKTPEPRAPAPADREQRPRESEGKP